VEVCQSPSEITTKRNYSSIAGDLVSGAIANAYHFRRIVGLVSYSRIFAIDIGANIGESVPQEVVLKRLTRDAKTRIGRYIPDLHFQCAIRLETTLSGRIRPSHQPIAQKSWLGPRSSQLSRLVELECSHFNQHNRLLGLS